MGSAKRQSLLGSMISLCAPYLPFASSTDDLLLSAFASKLTFLFNQLAVCVPVCKVGFIEFPRWRDESHEFVRVEKASFNTYHDDPSLATNRKCGNKCLMVLLVFAALGMADCRSSNIVDRADV